MSVHKDILLSCRFENLENVEKCLNEGISVDFQNSEGESPLQHAAANGFLNIVTFLLTNGASVDLPNNYGWTALMHAARHGHSDVVALLLKMKAKVNIRNKLGLSPVVAAVWSGNVSTLKLLIETGAMVECMLPPVNQSITCDLSPLMAAAYLGHTNILKLLLDEGAVLNQSSHVTGLTALMLAAYQGQRETLTTIVDRKGDVNEVNICGRTALDLAVAGGKKEIKDYLENITAPKYTDETLKSIDILQAVRNGDTKKVKSILQQKPETSNTSDSLGITPLMLASKLGHRNIAITLISAGANLDTEDKENGWTAFMFAVFHRHVDMVRILLEKGAQVDICTHNGYTVLDLARNIGSSEGTIIEKIITRSMLEELPSKSSFSLCASETKLSANEKFKSSHPQTRLKSWIGDMAQNLQNKVLTRLSMRGSNVSSTEVGILDDSMNEVFSDPISPLPKTPSEGPELNLNHQISSEFLSPDMYLAKELKEHKVEAITPPFPPISMGFPPFIKKQLLCDKNRKPRHMSLETPHLLKHLKIQKSSQEFGEVRQKKSLVMMRVEEEKSVERGLTMEADCSKASILHDKPEQDISPGELTVLLNKESLHKYAEKFKNQEIDIEVFQHLTENDLNEIGIRSFASQKKMLEIIKKLNATQKMKK